MCANPPPAWQQIGQVMRVCELIKRETQLQAALPGQPARLLARPLAPAVAPLAPTVAAPAASLSAPWRLNGNGYPGEVMLQQAADGTLSGTIYGNPLTGFHSAGDRHVVWLRGAPTQPDQAFVGSVSADGNAISGRLYGLTVSGGGVGPARNVFAFSALRAAPAHPGHPGLPTAAAGPASVAGTLALNANNIPGQLVLAQAPDGMLSGTIYGDRLSGHYAPGSGSIAFLRFTGTQPVQLYVGTVTAQGLSGEFYALTVPAGGSAQRMQYAWSAQPPQQVAQAAAPVLRPAPMKAAPAVMPAQPAAVFNPSSPDDAVLAPYPRGFDIAPGGRRFDGFAVGQPGPVRVMVRSAQPVVVAVRRADGRLVERTGIGDLAIDDAATDADVRQGLLWGVSIRPQQAGSGAQGQIMVSAPPADPQSVRAALERDRQAAAQQSQAALAQPTTAAVDPNAVTATRQRELDQLALARHSAVLQQIRAQLHPDTAAVMTQAQQSRAQGQSLAQAQGAMVNDARITRLAASGALTAGAAGSSAVMAPASGRLLAAPGVAVANAPAGAATPQAGAAPAQAGGTPAPANVGRAIDRMFKKDGDTASPAGSTPQQVVARPLITSASTAEGDPGTPVMLQGSNFGNARGEVRFIVANGRDLSAPITFWSATQIVTEVPAVEGVREFPGHVYLKRADGTQSDLRPFAFRPAMERRQLVSPAKAAWSPNGIEDARIHPYAVHYTGPSRSDITDGSFLSVVSRVTALFGGAGRDEYFLNGQLANGWRVESCVVGDYRKGSTGPRVTSGQASVTVAQCPVGTERMRTAVDWWFDFQSSFSYSLTLNIVGPKGVPHR